MQQRVDIRLQLDLQMILIDDDYFSPFAEGVSERTYSHEVLDAMKGKNRIVAFEGKEYDGYEATQKQRKMQEFPSSVIIP